jgi:hypothetical protein
MPQRSAAYITLNLMNATRKVTVSRDGWIVLALFVIPATLSFINAVWSASQTGNVTVISVGWNATEREQVQWISGWTRFVGPPLLLVGLWRLVTRVRSLVSSALIVVAGLVLLLFSWWFTNLYHVAVIVGINVYIVAALIVGNRYGGTSVLLLSIFGLLVFAWAKA